MTNFTKFSTCVWKSHSLKLRIQRIHDDGNDNSDNNNNKDFSGSKIQQNDCHITLSVTNQNLDTDQIKYNVFICTVFNKTLLHVLENVLRSFTLCWPPSSCDIISNILCLIFKLISMSLYSKRENIKVWMQNKLSL